MNMLQKLQKTVSAKAISMLLVVAMLFGAVPANTVLVANAAGETNLRLHLMVAEDQDFECPALNAWNSSDYTISGASGEVTPNGWSNSVQTMTKGVSENGITDYSIEIKGTVTGMQILDVQTSNGNASRYQNNVWDTAMAAFTADEPTDLYATYNQGTGAYTWYTDKACTQELELAKPAYFTVHFLDKDDWGYALVNYWNESQITISDVSGTGDKPTSWGTGTLNKLVKEDTPDETTGKYWHKVTFNGTITGLQILNSNGNIFEIDSETIGKLNALTGETPADVYLVDGVVYFNKADIPVSTATSTDLTVHFKNSKNWENVYGMFAYGTSWNAFEGYEYCKNNLGGILEENSKNEGWYSFNVKGSGTEAVNGLFNGGDWGDELQTANYSIPITKDGMEAWVTFTGETGKNISVSYEKPAGWVDGAAVGKPIDPASLSDIESPVINDDGTVTFNFEMPANDSSTSVALMGTLTDWDNGQEMTYDAEKDIYTLTLALKPGKYQYKFKTAKEWYTDPLNSQFESGNSLVKVPGLTVEGDNLAGSGPVEVTATIPADSTISAEDLTWSIQAVDGGTVDGISVEADAQDKTKAYVTADEDAQNGYFKVVVAYSEDGTDKTSELQLYYTKKAYLYEYTYKEDSTHKGKSDIYVWYNSQAGNVGYSLKEVNGDNIAYITIDDTTKNFGYIARLDGMWGATESEDREFGDRTLYVNTDDLYTKVKGGEGIQDAYLLPSGKTSYENGIKFAYRDDERFYNNTMDELAGSVVKVLYKLEGQETYTEAVMEYNAKDELFTYLAPAAELEEGNYEFYFSVDGDRVEDQYMDGKIEFRKPTLIVETTVTPEEADYDMNPVVSFDITVSDNSVSENCVSAITADLTELGYPGTTVDFSTTTNSGVLYIDRSVAAGTYNVPCTITDIWGNDTIVDVSVKVVARTDASPSWDESNIYFLLTDRFADGDSSNNYDVNKDKIEAYHGGDFKGLTSKLPYLQNLGVNTIWITPIVDNIDIIKNAELHQQAYHGYWAQDFTTIDEHLGTTEDLDNLIDEAAKRGIKVMVDIVVNHAGYDTNNNENFKGMLRTEEDLVPGDVILDELDKLPDFKTENEDVRAQLVAWQTAWANHETKNGNRIAYFRVDTVKHVDHETWTELKTSVAKDNPTFKMIGEYYGASINNTGDYLGNGQMDAVLDFDFKSQAQSFIEGKLDTVESALESRNSLLSSSLTTGQFLSSHDENGFLIARAGGDTAKAKVAASLQLTAKGVPVIYYGEEIALSGMNVFGDQDNNRYDMQFENLTAEQKSMLSHYQKLLAARNMYSDVFAAGDRTKVAGSDAEGYMVFKRSTASESVYVALNTSTEAKEVTFSVSGNDVLYNAYSGETVEVEDGQVTVTIPASKDGGTMILGAEKTLSGITIDVPDKTAYKSGEELDLTGLVVTGYYGGSRVTIQSDAYKVDASKFNKNVAGTYQIVVSYGGFSKYFNVSVTEADEKPQGGSQDGSQEPEQPKDIEATGVTLSQTEATVERGKELALTATVAPADTTNKAVVFTSDNEKVATVTSEGVVTAVATGTANIIATTVNGKSATCKVTVIVPATKVYVNQNLILKKGKTLQLTASVLPADSTDKLTWTSSNKKKVTVDAKGKIKAVAAGSATITVTTDSGKKAKCKVTVTKKAVKATKVTIKKTSKTMNVGDVKQLKVTVKPSKTTDTVTFKSSKKSVISVAKNGVITAKKPGKAKITATAGKKKATITITVKQPATAVTLNKTSATIKKGKTLKLKATLTPKNSTDKVTFKSSKKSVATVNSKGVVTAKKKGTTTITVKTTSGKTAKCKITVK